MPFSSNGNVKIYYEIEGQENGSPIILLTGGLGDMNMWRYSGYVKGLSGFELILVDHGGRGRSDKPAKLEDYKMDLFVSDIVTLMDNLRLKKSAFWAYSDGARVGFTFASGYPDRISALIASGNYGEWEPTERCNLS